MGRWIKRIILVVIPALVVGVVLAFIVVRNLVMGSLPIVSGEVPMPDLGAPVSIARDGLGIPTIAASSLEDALAAQGFVHAQDRFFQMDLARRLASGRLAELLGSTVLDLDRTTRPLHFEGLADQTLAALPENHRRWLAAYTRGVNEGLKRLQTSPPEYLLLGQPPREWTERDSILCIYSMWYALNFKDKAEQSVSTMRLALKPELAEFLTPEQHRWDAPMIADDPGHPWQLSIPGPDVVNRRKESATTPKPGASPQPQAGPLADLGLRDDFIVRGSNNFAIAGSRTPTGAAILATDMHLELSAPVIWHRARLQWPGRELNGVSLPGTPGIVAGTNGKLAWGFTNVEGDFQDLIIVEVDPANPDRYKAPDGSFEPFGRSLEMLEVRGGPQERLELRTTRWGVVTGRDAMGHPLVLKWTALLPGETNLKLFDLWQEDDIEKGLQIARLWRGPAQNVLIASSTGRIGWVVSGLIPKRVGFTGKWSVSWATPIDGVLPTWDGAISEIDRPSLLDPPTGQLYSANGRTARIEQSNLVGRGYDGPFRTARINELVATLGTEPGQKEATERELLSIQLDTRAKLLDFYRDCALEACDSDPRNERLKKAAAVIRTWNGYADPDQAAYPILRWFYAELRAALITPLTKPCRDMDSKFQPNWFNNDEPLRRILEDRPLHFLPSQDEDYPALLRRCVISALDAVEKAARKPNPTWGELNLARIQHPLLTAVGSLPLAGRWLAMPAESIAGDTWCVRVGRPSFGASERIVVSPGHEESAICELTTGESGHPWSPHFADQFESWRRGEAKLLNPGPPVTTLRLVPTTQP